MTIQDSIQILSQGEPFAVFIGNVRAMREDAIAELDKADGEGVLRAAGRIAALNAIMQTADADTLLRRFPDCA